MPRVAIMHYSCPPVIGGVEFIIRAHSKLLAEHGHKVKLVVGRGESTRRGVGLRVIPELYSEGGMFAEELNLLRAGRVPPNFNEAVKYVEKEIVKALRNVDVCLMHNVLTMHFNLVLTVALANIIERNKTRRFVGWVHDATFIDPLYAEHQRNKYPWTLLKEPIPGCDYCVISSNRQKEMSKLFGLPREKLPVIPDGIAVEDLLDMTPQVARLFEDEELFAKDIVALTPTRILRRKGLEAGIHIVAAFREMGKSVRWMITGAPDPHNPDSLRYFDELVQLRSSMDLEGEVIFLCRRFGDYVTNADLRGLYGLSDTLLFPSEREGFGIPVLEAGMMGLLVIVRNIPVMRELGCKDTVYIRNGEDLSSVAKRAVRAFERSPRLVYKKTVISSYSWNAVFADKILPAVRDPGRLWK